MGRQKDSAACTCLRYVDKRGQAMGKPIALARCKVHPTATSAFSLDLRDELKRRGPRV